MFGRLFFWTVVFQLAPCLQGSHAQETCSPENRETIQIVNVQSWDQMLNHEKIKGLLNELESDEQVKRIHFTYNVINRLNVEDATTRAPPPSSTPTAREKENPSTDDRTVAVSTTPLSTTQKDTVCEEGWHKASDNHCYKLFKSGTRFKNAFKNCRNQLNGSAILAVGIKNLTIRSEIIRNLQFQPKGSPRQIWIGLTQSESDKQFYWINGTQMTNVKGTGGWKDGEPNNNAERCAALDKNHSFKFGDFTCSVSGHYICESAHGYNIEAIDNWWKNARISYN